MEDGPNFCGLLRISELYDKEVMQNKTKCNHKEAFEETTVLKIDLYTVYSISMHLVALYTIENYYEYMV